MQKIVGIRFKNAGKIYYFDPQQIFLKLGDNVIVETARGMEFGTVASKVKYVEEETLKHPVKPVIRKATAKDIKDWENNLAKVPEALEICKQQVAKHKLNMKVIKAEYTFDATKVIFSFTADGRIDFRELVKDLAAIFRIRIELRQVGVRDESKMLGGVAQCGRELCCSKWLSEFEPVSIKMAKEQGLSLNPGKISGACGRLLCCLKYEHDHYEQTLSEMPDIGQKVKTKNGEGFVTALNVIKEKVTVRFPDEDGVMRDYPKDEVTIVGGKKHKSKKNDPDEYADLSPEEIAELKKLQQKTKESVEGDM